MLCKYHYCTQLTLLKIFQVLNVFDGKHGFLCVSHVIQKWFNYQSIARFHDCKVLNASYPLRRTNSNYTSVSPNGAEPGGRPIQGVGLRPLYCLDQEFESRWGHGSSSLVFVVCLVGSDLWYEVITRSEESYRVCVCMCVCVCVSLIVCNLYFVLGATAPNGPGPPHSRGS